MATPGATQDGSWAVGRDESTVLSAAPLPALLAVLARPDHVRERHVVRSREPDGWGVSPGTASCSPHRASLVWGTGVHEGADGSDAREASISSGLLEDTIEEPTALAGVRLRHSPHTDLALVLVADVTRKSALRAWALDRWRSALERRQARRRHQALLAREYYERSMRYLFFRAWQWRHQRRVSSRGRALAAAEMADKVRRQCALRVWRSVAAQRTEAKARAERLAREHARRLLQCMVDRWVSWCRRRSLAVALASATAQTHAATVLRGWSRYTLRLRQERLTVEVHWVHHPACWRVGREAGTRELLLRWLWVRWLRAVYERRRARLVRGAHAVEALQRSQVRRTREWVWQRWLLCTTSSAQARRRVHEVRVVFYRKWLEVVRQSRLAESMATHCQTRLLGELFADWQRRTRRVVNIRRDTGAADDFYNSRTLHHVVVAAFTAWRERWALLCRRRLLHSAGAQARDELLRHLGLSRLVEGVLTTALPARARVGVGPSGLGEGEGEACRVECDPRRQTTALPLLRPMASLSSAPVIPTASRSSRPSPVTPGPAVTVPAHARAPPRVDRATSPIPDVKLERGRHASTQTEGPTREAAAPPSPARSVPAAYRGRRSALPVYLRASHVDISGPSTTQAGRALEYAPLTAAPLHSEDVVASGTALVSVYRRLKAVAAEEHEELIAIGLETEQLTAFLEAMDRSEAAGSGEAERTAVVAEVATRAQELARRRTYLLLRDEQRRRLRARVEELAASLTRQLESS